MAHNMCVAAILELLRPAILHILTTNMKEQK